MSSLREEIALAIHNQIALPVERVNSDKAANATKAALYIIEKRIDEMIRNHRISGLADTYVIRAKLAQLDSVKEMLK